jgi:hypothetical protein
MSLPSCVGVISLQNSYSTTCRILLRQVVDFVMLVIITDAAIKKKADWDDDR